MRFSSFVAYFIAALPPAVHFYKRSGQIQTMAASPLEPPTSGEAAVTTPDVCFLGRRFGAAHMNGVTVMALQATAVRQPETGEDHLAADVSYFVDRLGWPVSIDTRQQRLVVCTYGDVLDALRVRRDLAVPIAHAMTVSLMFGPISRDGSWWTFITAPCQRTIELPADLHHAPIRAVPRGGEVVLPPVTATALWRNVPQPGHPLPPWSAVVALARSVIYRRG